jgi:hypothetical protein
MVQIWPTLNTPDWHLNLFLNKVLFTFDGIVYFHQDFFLSKETEKPREFREFYL